ncbi:MAG: FHA domain-containing serine/threonine-protein kinase [Planctomycetota bacterium]
MQNYWLIVRNGPNAGRGIEVREGRPVRLGSGLAADLLITDSRVSRAHCLVEAHPEGLRVQDLGSRYGTFVNGQRHAEAILRHQDRLAVGDTSIVVLSSADPDARREAASAGGKGPPPAPSHDVPGYSRLDLLGRGGIAEVHLVRRRSDGSQMAMKVLNPVIDADGTAFDRFRNEIVLLQKLDHPNIVRIHDCGVLADPGSPGRLQAWFTMEHCAGGSVDDLLRRRQRPLSIDEAEPLVLQALAGLSHLHQRRIVHRDVNPKNLLLTEPDGGSVRLSDFGLAKALSGDDASLGITTQHLPVSGTFGYLPREQLMNFKYVDERVDVWSMAATIYFMLTGETPYDVPDAPTELEALEALLRAPVVPMSRRAAGLPEAVAAVVDRALDVDPQRRPPNALELRKAFEKAL